LLFFVVCLVLSGVTAFPLVHELRWAEQALAHLPAPDGLVEWVTRVRRGLDEADAEYPFLLYGTDWLAFAHLVIAVAFWGPYRDPVRNIWVIEFGMIACAGVVPLALICGPIRGIPVFWMLIDMSFGVFGVIPLLILRRRIKRLEALTAAAGTGRPAGTDSPAGTGGASGAGAPAGNGPAAGAAGAVAVSG
jgi:hypothetical protein